MKLFCLFFIISINLVGSEFQNYLKAHNDQFIKYQKDIDADFVAYKKVYDEALKEYKNEINKKWPTSDVSTNFKWIEYGNNYNSKKIIDYQKGLISLSVLAKDRKDAEQKLGIIFDDLYGYDTRKGFMNDVMEQKISKKFDKGRNNLISNEKLISDMINKEQQKNLKNSITAPKLEETTYKENLIYKIDIKIPQNGLLQKAKLYKNQIKQQAVKLNLQEELIYGIIKNESSFNPLAKSYVPAFGLMQIVPQTAGVDAYWHIYGQKRLLDSEYLFDPSNNILIGSTYLSILYTKHLKDIKDPQSRLYCTIASYNTGSSNVARAFGNLSAGTKISQVTNEINSMGSDEVYKKLIKDLPFEETKKYLFKVRQSMSEYSKIMNNE